MSKICRKCGQEKPLVDFYKHPLGADGYNGVCKECKISYQRLKYRENLLKDGFLDSQRKRGRDKYKRLNYKLKPASHRENKQTRRDLRSKGVELSGLVVHHWDYNKRRDVFLLTARQHRAAHTFILFDQSSKKFKYQSRLLETKEAHMLALVEILEKQGLPTNFNVYP